VTTLIKTNVPRVNPSDHPTNLAASDHAGRFAIGGQAYPPAMKTNINDAAMGTMKDHPTIKLMKAACSPRTASAELDM